MNYDKLKQDFARLALHAELQDRFIERLALCPDHRDKGTGRCVVCQAEGRTAQEWRAEREGLRRYYVANEPLTFSTGIHDGLTWGYGKLDANGFWEFTVPFDFLRLEDQQRIQHIEGRTPCNR